MSKNWFGEEMHPSDDLINCRDRNPIETSKGLRVKWDKLVNGDSEKLLILEDLLQMKYNDGYNDGYNEGEQNNDGGEWAVT